jgi:replicative DNA helicase
MSDRPDQADLARAGKPLPDAKTNVRPVALNVPRVLTVLDLLTASVMKLDEPKGLRCTTGNYELDRITGGFRPGFTWLFGAATSFGKSSWLVAVADDNIRAKKKVLIVSSEDTEEVYGDRLMVRRSKVDATRYRDGALHDFEREAVNAELAKAEEIPVFVDARRYPVEDLAGHLKNIIREHAIDLVAFDYVQEFRTKRRFQDERVKFREIASVLRHVTKDAKIAGIIFSQLTTNERTRIPNRDNIRESRDMAHGAEVIVLGFEPDSELKGPKGEVIAVEGDKCLFVDKVKNGPRNRILKAPWHDEGAYFETVRSPDQAAIDAMAAQFDDFEDRRYP